MNNLNRDRANFRKTDGFPFQAKFLVMSLITVTLALRVNGDCFFQLSCNDTITGTEYRSGQTWEPAYDPCYSCDCISTNYTVVS